MTTLDAGHQYPAELALETQGRLQAIFWDQIKADDAIESNHTHAHQALMDIHALWDGYIQQVANFVVFASKAPGRSADFMLVKPDLLTRIDRISFECQVEKIEMLCPNFSLSDEMRRDIHEISLARDALKGQSSAVALNHVRASDLLRWHGIMLTLIGQSATAIAAKYRDVGPYVA